jgi:hypothetical protein
MLHSDSQEQCFWVFFIELSEKEKATHIFSKIIVWHTLERYKLCNPDEGDREAEVYGQ